LDYNVKCAEPGKELKDEAAPDGKKKPLDA
jgi:hypothetical protein